MRSSNRSSLAVAAVAACLTVLATMVTGLIDSKEIGGTSFTFVGWSSSSKQETYQSCTLTSNAFTIQGASTSLSDDTTLPPGNLQFSQLRVSGGYIVVANYFPRSTSITIKGASGIVHAEKPFIDASSAIYSNRLSIVVTDSDLRWDTAEAHQSVVRAPSFIQLSSALFVIGITVAEASSIVEVVGQSSISQMSVLAVDYTKCTGCAQGLVYFSFLHLWDRSLLRISHSSVKGADGTPLIGVAQGADTGVKVDKSLFVVENVASPTSNLINAPATIGDGGQLTLRTVTVKNIGGRITGSVKAKLLTADDSAQQIPSTSLVPDTGCADACVPPTTVDADCKCTCSADMPNRNFCTAMNDPYTNYVYLGCSVGCTKCSNETACLECGAGYNLVGTVCSLIGGECTDPNCKTCTTPGQCTDCHNGYGLTSSNACVRCSVAHCKSCPTNPGTCTMCLSGSEPVGNVCTPCSNANCVSCPGGANTCTQCASGYRLVDGTCEQCQVSDCLNCDNDPSKCTQCAPNYYLNSLSTCSPAACGIKHCTQCDEQTPSRCQHCETPYTVDSYDGLCMLSGTCSVANCTTCQAGTSKVCTTCDTNYYLTDGKCKAMPDCYVANCAQCMLLDSTKCSTCLRDYTLTTSYICVSITSGAATAYSLWVAAAALLVSVATHLV
ncbi:surface antigen-like protein [Leishmania tarentolae]|uniref:Surface antigen-like protein n=1 Tax=Leishmania tarentolae TaxID=5689 RepID=A0A640K877_LEITA|nr:surface antigen-like protein [Leishmania tarentolae]